MQPTAKVKEKINIVGKVIVRSHPAGSVDRFLKFLEEAGNDPVKRQSVLEMIRGGKLETEQHNTIMEAANIGKDILIQWLLGISTYPLGINWGAIGTDNTLPAITDTRLTNEYARSTVSFSEDSAYNEAIFQFFFTDSMLTNQTYNEFGVFINGTASANTGQIFNHALFSSPVNKTAGTDLTVEVDLSFA